jgi:hypothetical protein
MRIPRPGRPPVHYKSELAILNSEGKVLQSIGGVPFGDLLPLGKATQVASSDKFVYVGTADSAFVDAYRVDGTPAATFPIGVEGRRTTQRHRDAVIETAVSALVAGERDMARAMLRSLPIPEELPPYYGLFTDVLGNLWAVTSLPGDSATSLMAIDGKGQRIGEIRVPLELRVFEIGEDYILGGYLASNGEPHVAIYRLRRTDVRAG